MTYLTDHDVLGGDIWQLSDDSGHKDVQVISCEWYYVGSLNPQHSLHCKGQLSTQYCGLTCTSGRIRCLVRQNEIRRP